MVNLKKGKYVSFEEKYDCSGPEKEEEKMERDRDKRKDFEQYLRVGMK